MIIPIITNILLVLVGILAVALGALYVFFQVQYSYWGKKGVPHPKPTIPFGTIEGANKKHIAVALKDVYEKGKKHRFYGTWQFHRPNLVINDLDLIKKILVTDFMSFHDRGIHFDEEKDPVSANLLTIEGVAWKNLRSKLSPTFTSGKMKMMFPIMADTSKVLVDVLKQPASLGEVIEMKEFAARFTTDVISSCAFGIEANSLKNPNAEFRKYGKKIFESSFESIIRNILAILTPDLARALGISQFPGDVTNFFLTAVKDIVEQREKNDIKRNDVLQLLIQLKNKGYVDDVDGGKEINEKDKFTINQVAAQAFIFFLGGFETSSTTMQFALYELALDQECQKKARDEIKRVLAKYKGEMTYEAIYEMDYLGRVIDETLRKHPPGPVLGRICTKDYRIPDSDVTIEKGTSVAIPVYAIQMDERYFPNPQKFDPDRFTDEEKAKTNNFAYLPFGAGPRFCIGQRFGLMQTRVGLISLLSNYKFDVAIGKTPIPMEYDPKSFVFAPIGGMNLKISLVD